MPRDREAKKTLQRRLAALRVERDTVAEHWRDIRDFILPDHGSGLNDAKRNRKDGDKRQERIYDATATRAMDMLAAGLMGGLTSPARPWFRLSTPDPIDHDRHDVRVWLSEVEEAMRTVMSKSNLYKALHHCYAELAGFGTGPISIVEDFDRVIHCRPMTVGEYYLGVDHKGRVNVCYRELRMTASQMIEEFGREYCSISVRNAYDNGQPDAKFTVVHAIEPNDDRISLRDAQDRPFRSIYWEVGGDDDLILRVSGFDEFPILGPRWFVVGSQVYGRSPGMRVLPDVKQLQKETRLKLEAIDKVVDPPVSVPGGPSEHSINTFRGGVTYDTTAMGGSGPGIRPLYQIAPDLGVLMHDIQDLRMQIRQGLFNDLFLMLAGSDRPQMTAREVAERHEEKMLMLGPVLERLHDELLTPMIDRVFNVMARAEIIRPAPEALQGVTLKVEYISIMAQAMKMAGVSAIESFTGFVGNLASVNPTVLDKVDFDELADVYADRMGVPPTIIVPDEQVAEIRQARANQEQQQQGLLAAEQIANTAKTLADTDVSQGSALPPVAAAMAGMGGM